MGALTGEVPERPNGAVSKTVVGPVPTVGSNPTLSAKISWGIDPLLYKLEIWKIRDIDLRPNCPIRCDRKFHKARFLIRVSAAHLPVSAAPSVNGMPI